MIRRPKRRPAAQNRTANIIIFYSIIITLFSALVMVLVSYATPAPQYERIKSLTFGTATDEDRTRTTASWGWQEAVASAFILLCILGAYLYFRG